MYNKDHYVLFHIKEEYVLIWK